MDTTPPPALFDEAYDTGTAPWVIGAPQPAVVALEREGRIRGAVLDVGCGTGEHTVHLSALGYDVLGVDVSESGLARARAIAAERGVPARFQPADALDLGPDPAYDTVLDSALFHLFDRGDRARYVRSLRAVVKAGGVLHLLALSDTGPKFGPQVSGTDIREAFADGWEMEELALTGYRGMIVRPEHAELMDRPIGEQIEVPAWLARLRRV